MNDDFLKDTDDQTVEHAKAEPPVDETRHPDVTARISPAPVAPTPYYNRTVTVPPPPPPPTRGSPAT